MSYTKVKEFNGDEAEFPTWKVKFEAMATMKGFGEALDPNFKTEMPARFDEALNLSNNDEKKKKEALVKNNVAMSYFTMGLTGDDVLCMIEEVKTPEFPGGIACDLWTNLMEEYRPDDTIGAAQQLNDLWH